ncbi:MAG: macrolide ABC transporter ATP-binding protein [Candidatus Brennerbacteria bacterium RIFOXYC1_FULL_41_11]|uniref:Macrolide ABC transporter ATP-binding protein n=1 Tax=Candidatus Brennerbacteria bacterium RIFOXYD1_FULL_41_16 TaxID=1797529 RepID=A0A1G1XLT2_9BACT|nr:MAG: macrolide ABC transporter ATP-binding protein [Candidatus Brennerbacteria bacterium RIFOXYB1_FULL_41_13]OGY38875.1 MAG: macrolide ABC transporter ATP-binding protein [Candidatus Brennerbacteria bacterium RIFOXYC1_FULL_41_11]OGY41033.1 MAG: macrolide ABC transporter ATP-binding protein [Candidatus Brennerbacteria bacterium RIFOXYD1_FULL_41_16]
MIAPLIQVKNLSKIYGDESAKTKALEDASFSIDPGEFVAIMGPSGSGKSTLLHILGFLDEQTHGSYVFNGKERIGYSKEEMARLRNEKMGFVFQSFNLLPRITVLDNIKLPLIYSDVPEHDWNKKAKQALEKVGLSHRLFFQPSQLSGGEKQRAAIARALINEPEVIFADEPTGNLDSKSGGVVMNIFESLNREGHTIILITHDKDIAEHARRIIGIKDGRIESDRKNR